MQNKKWGIRIIFVVILAIILMLIACSKVRQTSPLQKFTYNSGKVNSEVLASLKSNGIVPVIITTTDFDSRVEVISILTKDEFNIKRGFDSVPAFAGDVQGGGEKYRHGSTPWRHSGSINPDDEALEGTLRCRVPEKKRGVLRAATEAPERRIQFHEYHRVRV